MAGSAQEDSSTFARHRPLFERIRAFTESRPDFSGYVREKYGKLADPVQGAHITRLLEYELAVSNVELKGKRVVDAGCGSGYYSVLFCALGASVNGFDYFPENIHALDAIRHEFGLPIVPARGDVSATGLEPDSVDFVYCTEAISHFADWKAFVAESHRVLRRGGRLLIADGNNGANPAVRKGIHDLWTLSECGPFTVDRFPPSEPTPYLYRRWLIIRARFPRLGEEEVFQLGLRTAGLGGQALIEACERYSRDRTLPESAYRRGMSQRRPEDGQANEEPLDPRDVAAHLRSIGFDAHVRPHYGFGRSRLLPVLNEIGTRLGSIAIRFALRYLVIAVKTR